MHPNVAKLARMLTEAGAAGEPIELTDPAPTAVTAAEQLGCPVGAIANSLVFNADGKPLLVLTSGAHRVDTAKVAALVGAEKVRRADPDFVKEHSGYPIGGVPPVGHPTPIPTLVDTWLDRYGQVWAAAGHAHWVFPSTFAELVRLTGGTVAEVGAD